ncbi:TMV resistance protein N-like [Pyrus ussuriensis x Pyrus communis]|uniref:TMV resistance protein N-like n=1 Tax=Pyrus ussuriensis x Pyrus communis TaxID=2448454 RepID=A0A5N5FJV9_9ROSA|nr:TMV resistance protein N-like [Pyrus ussuriensis x Pyrus communis]
MKTGVNLFWDDGDGGDAYSSNDEIGAVQSNTSSDETLPSPSVHTDSCPPMASDLKKPSVKPKYRHEFYQKPEEVVVTIFAKGMAAKDVNVEFGEQIPSVSIDVAEIRLAKAEPLHWTSLEFSKDNPVPLRVSGPVVGVSSPDYWDVNHHIKNVLPQTVSEGHELWTTTKVNNHSP